MTVLCNMKLYERRKSHCADEWHKLTSFIHIFKQYLFGLKGKKLKLTMKTVSEILILLDLWIQRFLLFTHLKTFVKHLGMLSNTWYVSDEGSDDNDCHSVSAPCRNLQTVLDRATDGADIYVTSLTLSLDAVHTNSLVNINLHYFKEHYLSLTSCLVVGSISYSINSINGSHVNVTCSGQYNQ